jgi:transcriptional regulator with XRE-family HTH domain
MENELYYKNMLNRLIKNTILNTSAIAKLSNQSLSDFTKLAGFSISAVSRIRKSVREESNQKSNHDSYALCMLTALDSVYLFENIPAENRKEIQDLLLKDLCESVPTFLRVDGTQMMSNALIEQNWFVVDHEKGKGFVYQAQYFMHQINQAKIRKDYDQVYQEMLEKLPQTKVAFTTAALIRYQNTFFDIKKDLENLLDRSLEKNIYVPSEMAFKILYGEIPEDIKKQTIPCSPSSLDEKPLTLHLQDLIEIEESLLQDQSTLLLFVGDESDMKKYADLLNGLYKDQIILAYLQYSNHPNRFQIIFHYKGIHAPMKTSPESVLDLLDQR